MKEKIQELSKKLIEENYCKCYDLIEDIIEKKEDMKKALQHTAYITHLLFLTNNTIMKARKEIIQEIEQEIEREEDKENV